MANIRPGAGSVNNYFSEAFPDFEPGDDAGETLTLISNGSKWVVVDEHGVTLS